MTIVKIPLTHGKVTIVDNQDWPLMAGYRWYALRGKTAGSERWYAAACHEGRTVYMHRVITHAGPGEKVDHKNWDGLDNRRTNLRLCTNAQNMANQRTYRGRAGMRGVYPRKERWRARIWVGYRGISLGTFDSPEEAARARDEAAQRFHGEFAVMNASKEP